MPRPPLAVRRLLRFSLGAFLLFGLASVGSAELPAAAEKPVPENVEDLRAIQKQVRAVLDKVIPCTVGVQVGGSSGSGVIVSADGYVLTAGHVSDKPNLDCVLIFADGKRVKGKTLGHNKGIDSGMIKITDEGKYPFVEMGNSADLKRGQWVISTGHPGGYKPGRSPVVRLGRVLMNKSDAIQTDCTLVGGDSGGPLFDLNGKVVGINSRIGPGAQSNIHVPVDTFRETWDRLAKGDTWGGFTFGGRDRNAPYLGLRLDVEDKKACKVLDVSEGGPAAGAGLKAGDVILKFDRRPVSEPGDLDIVLRGKKPGDEVEVEVKRGDDTLTLMLKVGKKS